MRRAFQSLALLLLWLNCAQPLGAAERITLMVGGVEKIIYLPVALADQLGYFKEQGLDVVLHSEWSGIHGVDVLLVGTVQGVVGFYDHTIYMQAKGKAITSVIQFAQAPGEVELVSARLPHVRSMADLKDQPLGVTGLGSSTQFLSRCLLYTSPSPRDS